MLDYLEAHGGTTLPAGNYQAVDGFDALIGTPLNGDWTISVQDRYGADNGFILSWTAKFNPDIFRPECEID